MRKFIRFLVALIIGPFVIFVMVPTFVFFDYLCDDEGSAKFVFLNWMRWITFK